MTDSTTIKGQIEANKEQLCERVKVDRQFIHNHWASERAAVNFVPPTARTILDLGCGNTGGLLAHLPEMDYVGVDFVHNYLASLRRTRPVSGPWGFGYRVWVVSPMETLPFPNEFFDVVYSRHALEHSTNIMMTLSEIKRVLNPGGIFIFCVPARIDDYEPTHITRWPARKWLKAFQTVGTMRFHAQNNYFIDELYGYVEKLGKRGPSLMTRMRHKANYLRGQGILPHGTMQLLVRARQSVSRLIPHSII